MKKKVFIEDYMNNCAEQTRSAFMIPKRLLTKLPDIDIDVKAQDRCGYCGYHSMDCTCPPGKDIEKTPEYTWQALDSHNETTGLGPATRLSDIEVKHEAVFEDTFDRKECYFCKKPTHQLLASSKMPICHSCALVHLDHST